MTKLGGLEEALRSRKHSTVSAAACWWVAIGTVAVGRTVGAAVLVVTGVAQTTKCWSHVFVNGSIMCVREHGCGLHALHNGERVARFPQQLEKPLALRSRKHSTVSAGASWWTGAVPEISKVFVPWTIWVAIGAVAVGKTVDATVLGNLLLYKNGHDQQPCQRSATVESPRATAQSRSWPPVDAQQQQQASQQSFPRTATVQSPRASGTRMSTNLSMNCDCGTCGICTDLCTVRPWAPVVAQQTGMPTTSSKICNCGIPASICTVGIMATCRRTTTTGKSTNLSKICTCWISTGFRIVCEQHCRSWNAVDVTVIVVTGASQITVRAGVRYSTTGADCTCSATTGRDCADSEGRDSPISTTFTITVGSHIAGKCQRYLHDLQAVVSRLCLPQHAPVKPA